MLSIIRRQNYVILLLIILLLIIILSLMAFLMAANFPDVIASSPVSYEIKEIYSFEPWHLSLSGLEISFPSGGAIAPLFIQEEIRGAFFQGQGEFVIDTVSTSFSERLLLFTPGEQLDFITHDIILVKISDKNLINDLKNVLTRLPHPPVLFQNFVPLSFDVPAGELYLYYFEEGLPSRPMVINAKPLTGWLAVPLYMVLLSIMVLIIKMLSLEYKAPRFWQDLHSDRPSRNMLLAIIPGLFLVAAAEQFVQTKTLPTYFTATGYVLAAALFLSLNGRERILLLKLHKHTWKQGFPLAIIVAFLFILLPLQLPQKVLDLFSLNALVHFFLAFLLIGLTRELFWRGILQPALSRFAGPVPGIIMTGILTGIAHFFQMLLNNPVLLEYSYIYVELAVLVPGTAMIIGYIYYKTGNILSCALLHTLIFSLPPHLVYYHVS